MQFTLKALRINQGYDQKYAAKKLGVSQATLSNWERGITFPGAKQIKRIEEVYGVQYNQIIFLPRNNALSV